MFNLKSTPISKGAVGALMLEEHLCVSSQLKAAHTPAQAQTGPIRNNSQGSSGDPLAGSPPPTHSHPLRSHGDCAPNNWSSHIEIVEAQQEHHRSINRLESVLLGGFHVRYLHNKDQSQSSPWYHQVQRQKQKPSSS